MSTTLERLGGEAWLKPLIERFVERVYADAMIGFFFASVAKSRIVTLEMQHAAEHLGSPNAYRYHVRSPSFINLTALEAMCLGHTVADVVGILGSLDIVLGEVDR